METFILTLIVIISISTLSNAQYGQEHGHGNHEDEGYGVAYGFVSAGYGHHDQFGVSKVEVEKNPHSYQFSVKESGPYYQKYHHQSAVTSSHGHEVHHPQPVVAVAYPVPVPVAAVVPIQSDYGHGHSVGTFAAGKSIAGAYGNGIGPGGQLGGFKVGQGQPGLYGIGQGQPGIHGPANGQYIVGPYGGINGQPSAAGVYGQLGEYIAGNGQPGIGYGLIGDHNGQAGLYGHVNGQLGPYAYGNGQPGPNAYGKGQAGPNIFGNGQVGPNVYGNGQAGPNVYGNGQAGPNVYGNGQPGPGQYGYGNVKLGHGNPQPNTYGFDRGQVAGFPAPVYPLIHQQNNGGIIGNYGPVGAYPQQGGVNGANVFS